MDDAIIYLFRTLTRFFIPGVVLLLVLFTPVIISLTPSDALRLCGTIGTPALLFVAVAMGYVMDGYGAYALVIHRRAYEASKRLLAARLREATKQEAGADPDVYVTDLWLHAETTYERLFRERAEWVVVLVCSHILLLGVVVAMALATAHWTIRSVWLFESLTAATYLFLSFVMSGKGIQRMVAHDAKLVAAVSEHLSGRSAVAHSDDHD